LACFGIVLLDEQSMRLGTERAPNAAMAEATANPAAAVDVGAPFPDGSSGVAQRGSGKKKAAGIRKYLYALLGLILVSSGVALWVGMSSSTAAVPTAGAESTLALDTFIVNLDGGGQRAYLRVGITLGLAKPLPHKKDEVPIAPLRDAILTVLSTAHPEQLLAAEGKQKLKTDLLRALDERAPELGIDNVYFTEFLVQM
jgi:flagellar basal body-associated protein FliL